MQLAYNVNTEQRKETNAAANENAATTTPLLLALALALGDDVKFLRVEGPGINWDSMKIFIATAVAAASSSGTFLALLFFINRICLATSY
jgi:hypothetical protein